MRGRSLVPSCGTRWIASRSGYWSQLNSGLAVFLALAGFLALAPTASTQEPPGATAANTPPKDERNLLQRTGWIRLDVVGGRIAVLGHRCGQSRVLQTGEPTETPREQLSVQLGAEALVVHYEDVKADGQVLVDLNDQQRLTISRSAASPTLELTFVQPFNGPIALSVGRDPVQTFTASSLWHLALKHPELCEESLFPLLETLRPHWRLKDQAAALREALVNKSGTDVTAERTQWRKWVSQLDSDDFAERQNADRQLRGSGQAIAAWLQRLDRKQLSAEQAGRVNDICQGLSSLSTDTPQRVALWMVDDRCVWLSLLKDSEVSIRLAAANHLTLLCGKPVAFDPFASDSDRQQQLATLQQRFTKP
jgi:hypothetical protein